MPELREGDSFADHDKAMQIVERLSVRWASVLDLLSEYDGPEPRPGEVDARVR